MSVWDDYDDVPPAERKPMPAWIWALLAFGAGAWTSNLIWIAKEFYEVFP